VGISLSAVSLWLKLTRKYSIGSSDPPSPNQLEGMEFLNGVVQETMRVHASGTAIALAKGCFH